nr:transcription elongation factor GreA [Spiroplasma syrphidicola]
MMPNEEILLTKEGIKDLQAELDNLINIVRPQVIEELKEARAQGDLSENADYDAARNRQAEVEGRIKQIEGLLTKAKEIKEVKSKAGVIKLGSKVTFTNLLLKKDFEIKIVGAVEANPFENTISNESPIAKAIIGKKVGETVEIKGIQTPYKVTIVSVA